MVDNRVKKKELKRTGFLGLTVPGIMKRTKWRVFK
jgi:hypothetical protein